MLLQASPGRYPLLGASLLCELHYSVGLLMKNTNTHEQAEECRGSTRGLRMMLVGSAVRFIYFPDMSRLALMWGYTSMARSQGCLHSGLWVGLVYLSTSDHSLLF